MRGVKILVALTLVIAGKPVFAETGCVWGDCQNGVGKYVSNSNWYNIASYKNGKKDGVGLYFYNEAYMSTCIVRYASNFRNGLQICLWDGKNVTYRYFNAAGSRNNEPYLRVDQRGNVIEFGITKNEKKNLNPSEVLPLSKIRSERALLLSNADELVRKYIPLGLVDSPLPSSDQYKVSAAAIVSPSTKIAYSQADLERGGWDMTLCRKIPRSRYKAGKAEDRISVTFVNDTGRSVYPAYSDLKGKINFLAKRSAEQVWDDRTYLKTNWVWFSEDRKCLGWVPSARKWSDKFQLVSSLAQSN